MKLLTHIDFFSMFDFCRIICLCLSIKRMLPHCWDRLKSQCRWRHVLCWEVTDSRFLFPCVPCSNSKECSKVDLTGTARNYAKLLSVFYAEVWAGSACLPVSEHHASLCGICVRIWARVCWICTTASVCSPAVREVRSTVEKCLHKQTFSPDERLIETGRQRFEDHPGGSVSLEVSRLPKLFGRRRLLFIACL